MYTLRGQECLVFEQLEIPGNQGIHFLFVLGGKLAHTIVDALLKLLEVLVVFSAETFDGDFFTRIRPAPNADGPVTLQYHVIAEESRQPRIGMN